MADQQQKNNIPPHQKSNAVAPRSSHRAECHFREHLEVVKRLALAEALVINAKPPFLIAEPIDPFPFRTRVSHRNLTR